MVTFDREPIPGIGPCIVKVTPELWLGRHARSSRILLEQFDHFGRGQFIAVGDPVVLPLVKVPQFVAAIDCCYQYIKEKRSRSENPASSAPTPARATSSRRSRAA
jgi:hypothetical protein